MGCVTVTTVRDWLRKGLQSDEPCALLEKVYTMPGMPDEAAKMYAINLDEAKVNGIGDEYFNQQAIVGLELEDEIALFVGGVLVFELTNCGRGLWLECSVPWVEILEELHLR